MKLLTIRKRNLADAITSKRNVNARLVCPECGGEWSANAGDYWNLPPDHIFKCGEDGALLQLMEKVIYYRRAKAL